MHITPLKVALLLLVVAVFLWVAGYQNGGSACTVTYKTETVNGNSLRGFIEHGSQIQTAFGYYACHEVTAGDVVLYDDAGNSNPIIKIVRAVSGDTFALALSERGTKIVVNGEVLKTTTGEPYLISEKARNLLALYERDYEGVIPDQTVLLLGNLPGGSQDSTRFGLVSVGSLLGRVVKMAPLQE